MPKMSQNLSAQFVCPSPKYLDFNEKRLHCASVVRVHQQTNIICKKIIREKQSLSQISSCINFLNFGIPFTAYKLGKEYVKGNNSNLTLKEHTSMDQNNDETEGRLDALIDDKILNIGIIVGGVLFSTGVLICFCILCGFMKRNNQFRNLNSVDEESQIQRTFLRYSV